MCVVYMTEQSIWCCMLFTVSGSKLLKKQKSVGCSGRLGTMGHIFWPQISLNVWTPEIKIPCPSMKWQHKILWLQAQLPENNTWNWIRATKREVSTVPVLKIQGCSGKVMLFIWVLWDRCVQLWLHMPFQRILWN